MLKNILNQYDVIGIRTTSDDEQYSVGDACRKSYDWDYELDCSTFDTENPIKLSGTCAIGVNFEDIDDMTEEEILIRINKTVCNYIGGQVVLIGGNYTDDYCNDENEVIINNAIVLKVME